jgi:hypothetical protein
MAWNINYDKKVEAKRKLEIVLENKADWSRNSLRGNMPNVNI